MKPYPPILFLYYISGLQQKENKPAKVYEGNSRAYRHKHLAKVKPV